MALIDNPILTLLLALGSWLIFSPWFLHFLLQLMKKNKRPTTAVIIFASFMGPIPFGLAMFVRYNPAHPTLVDTIIAVLGYYILGVILEFGAASIFEKTVTLRLNFSYADPPRWLIPAIMVYYPVVFISIGLFNLYLR